MHFLLHRSRPQYNERRHHQRSHESLPVVSQIEILGLRRLRRIYVHLPRARRRYHFDRRQYPRPTPRRLRARELPLVALRSCCDLRARCIALPIQTARIRHAHRLAPRSLLHLHAVLDHAPVRILRHDLRHFRDRSGSHSLRGYRLANGVAVLHSDRARVRAEFRSAVPDRIRHYGVHRHHS